MNCVNAVHISNYRNTSGQKEKTMNDFETYKRTQQQKQDDAADAFYAGARKMSFENSMRRKNGLQANHGAEDLGKLVNETGYKGLSYDPEFHNAIPAYLNRRDVFLEKHCPEEYGKLKAEYDRIWNEFLKCEFGERYWDLVDQMDTIDEKLDDLYDMKHGDPLEKFYVENPED